MANSSIPLSLKIKLAIRSVPRVVIQPVYLLLTLLTAWIFLGILVWFTNVSVLRAALTSSSLSVADKLEFMLSGYQSIVTNFEPAAAFGLALLAILFGINTALLIFVVRGSAKAAAKNSGQGFAAALAGVVSAGCAACGTSILAPLLSGVGAAASVGLVTFIGIAANVVAFGLLLYSIYKLGIQAATVLATSN